MVVPRGNAAIFLDRSGPDNMNLRVRTPGAATVRVTWSPYWRAAGACVERAGDWTRVIARRPGAVGLRIAFSPERVVSQGRRCG